MADSATITATPLTINDLHSMIGEPVYITAPNFNDRYVHGEWYLLATYGDREPLFDNPDDPHPESFTFTSKNGSMETHTSASYGKVWLPFATNIHKNHNTK